MVDTLVAALNVGGEAALFERLESSTALVILDNCEHVIDAAAALAVRLLDAAPGVRILCTSQVPLDVDGEVVFELAPLALSDAVELFGRRADAQRRRRASPEADDPVHELCAEQEVVLLRHVGDAPQVGAIGRCRVARAQPHHVAAHRLAVLAEGLGRLRRRLGEHVGRALGLQVVGHRRPEQRGVGPLREDAARRP